MTCEIINRIEITDKHELFIGLSSNGHSTYQYIYREASGVYWNNTDHGFISTEIQEWSHSKWFSHIIHVVRSSLNVELKLSNNINWTGISEIEKNIIVNEYLS